MLVQLRCSRFPRSWIRQIVTEARAILYNYHFKFDDLSTLLNFLSMASDHVRSAITHIEVSVYKKSVAVPAFSLLATCTSLIRLHLATGVGCNATPSKAAKAFFQDAARFMVAVGRRMDKKDAAMDIVRFGRSAKCFSVKEGDETRVWDDAEKQEFEALLKAKLQ